MGMNPHVQMNSSLWKPDEGVNVSAYSHQLCCSLHPYQCIKNKHWKTVLLTEEHSAKLLWLCRLCIVSTKVSSLMTFRLKKCSELLHLKSLKWKLHSSNFLIVFNIRHISAFSCQMSTSPVPPTYCAMHSSWTFGTAPSQLSGTWRRMPPPPFIRRLCAVTN